MAGGRRGSLPTQDFSMLDEVTKLVQQARHGDVRAFEQLFQRFQRRIYNIVYQMVGQVDDADDLTQEVFIRAYQGLPRLRDEGTFSIWLHRIALNLCRTHLKKARLWRRLTAEALAWPGQEDHQDTLEQIPDPTGIPGEQMEKQELQSVIRQAVASLPPHYREVVVLHHLEGYDLETVATLLGCAQGTVKSRLARARAMLKERLQEYVVGREDSR